MRQYRDELIANGRRVLYHELGSDGFTFDERLEQTIRREDIEELIHFEIEDRFMEDLVHALVKRCQLKHVVLPSPQFMTSRQEFAEYLASVRKPFMKTFYERQRKYLNILVEKNRPIGGKWSYDEDNRQKLPQDAYIEPLPLIEHHQHVLDVIELVKETFLDHPGNPDEFWLPTNRKQALAWLHDFLTHRFRNFGPYEDALHSEHATLNHSVLTPALNCGLLTPSEVVARALEVAKQGETPLASVEGFVRQIIGWREFVRGIYHAYPDEGETNFWNHHRRLAKTWYTGETGLEPLDLVIKRALRRGYTHHIERLMIVGNIMLLSEVHPKEAYRWFMELYVDSSDWVMGPNVYGMSQMSDGGIFTTKPYVCGSAYLLKMSNFRKGPWCDVMDGLYWRFVEKHKEFFRCNPRLSVMAKQVEKLDFERKKRIFAAAEAFIEKNTIQKKSIL
jgi:deoxyribodipyrimidine photolyase-related protein